MSKLTIRVRQWLTRYETDLDVKQLLLEVLAKCETDSEVKQLLTQMLTERKTELTGIKKLFTQLLTEQRADPQEIKRLFTQVMESCDKISHHLHKMPQITLAAKKTYEAFLMEKFIREKAELDVREGYSALLQGLDRESIHTVNTILARIEMLHSTDREELDIFNEDEQQQIKALYTNFWPNIFQLDEDCFAYMDYLLPIKHFEPSVFFYRHELHHLATPERVGEKAIMDIGGFIGDSALVFAKEFNGQIHSFEPTSINYERILPINMGIADTVRRTRLYVDGSVSSEYPGQFAKEPSETAEMITLDSYVAQRNIEVGLIKIDTEGAEQDILKGAVHTIRTQRPTLIISIYHSAYDFFQIKPMLESWDLGYKFKIRRPVDGQIMSETVLLAETE